MPDGTNQTVSAEGQPLGDAPGFEPIGPEGTTVRTLSLTATCSEVHAVLQSNVFLALQSYGTGKALQW